MRRKPQHTTQQQTTSTIGVQQQSHGSIMYRRFWLLSTLFYCFLHVSVSFGFQSFFTVTGAKNHVNNHKTKTTTKTKTALSSQYGGVEEFDNNQREMWQRRAKQWVILVDDEESIRKGVGQLLFDRGFQVTACSDAPTALKVALGKEVEQNGQVTTRLPDCIVSDVRMPGMDGIELLKKIRADEKLVRVPVILLTAKGLTRHRIEGYNAGADAYLPKPFDPEELVTIIDNVIDRYEMTSGANVEIDELKRDLNEIKHLLVDKGGGGVGNGWVAKTDIFLAPDEREILELLCQGLMTKEIAEKKKLSGKRIEQVLTGLFKKVNVKNRTELVRWALATGNVQL